MKKFAVVGVVFSVLILASCSKEDIKPQEVQTGQSVPEWKAYTPSSTDSGSGSNVDNITDPNNDEDASSKKKGK